MKRIISILSAGVIALMAVSCVQEQLVTFDTSKATAPVLNSYQVTETEITAAYTAGAFNQGFNQKMTPSHTLAIVSVDGKNASKTVSTSDKNGVLTLKNATLAKALIALGQAEGSTVSVSLAVRASMQDLSKDNGINGFVDSEGTISIPSFEVVIPEVIGSPYADYTEESDWSVIGALSAYDINWDGDLEMFATEDGTKFVAKAVTIKKGDQFKFRKDLAWDTNYGASGDVEPYVISVDTELAGAAGGKNLGVPADGIYDLWLDLSGSDAVITITDAYLPYPEHTQASTWSIIGALSNYGINWDGDLPMTTDGKTFVAQGIKISKDDQFKFRKDLAWDTNFGAPGDVEPFVVTLDSESPAAAGGKNLAVSEDGIFDLILDADGQTYTVIETLGGGVSGKVGGDEPEPEPVSVTGWNIIGLNGDWDNDILATEDNGVWTAYITAKDATIFKWRKDGAWEENYGGTLVTLGEPFAAEEGGRDISIPAGFYKVVLDLNALTITVSEGNVYSLIGEINGDSSWSTDIFMTEKDGIWTSATVNIEGGFKIRHNASWADEDVYGAEKDFTVEPGKPFTAVQPGNDISVDPGQYKVQFNPETKEVLISEFKYPEQLYMIGTEFGNWVWSSDAVVEMIPVLHHPDWGANAEGQFWTVRWFTAGEGFKFCSQRAWNGDFWGLTDNDGFTEVGGNCTVSEDGFYLVHIDFKNEKVHVEPARIYGIGDCFGGWDAKMEGALFSEKDGKLVGKTTAAGKIRLYAESSISTSDWWTREFVFFDGKIAYRGNGGDQDPVEVEADKTISLDFNAGTAVVE